MISLGKRTQWEKNKLFFSNKTRHPSVHAGWQIIAVKGVKFNTFAFLILILSSFISLVVSGER